MVLLYNFFIRLYSLGIRLLAVRNKKAAELFKGRKAIFSALQEARLPDDRIIWLHCASAGELEQGKPVMEALKSYYPKHKILVSFFSPSGYSAGKKYKDPHIISYLPSDTKSNARRFVDLVKPELVIFIKYEYWYHHLSELASRDIPVLLVSAIFRKEQVFFKWYGKFFREILFLFRRIFVQDSDSAALLQSIGVMHTTIGGDTRFDRVQKIATEFKEIPGIRSFAEGAPVIVAGSTWPEDEALFAPLLQKNPFKCILAPHEIHPSHLEGIKKLFPKSVLYSEFIHNPSLQPQILIIDNFGMLSRIYQYATICYIGGGFNKSGIHNTLEAAVYGKPVLFGPQYKKFREARDLVANGAAFSVSNAEELQSVVEDLINRDVVNRSGSAASRYVKDHQGATSKIVEYIQEYRLLTSW